MSPMPNRGRCLWLTQLKSGPETSQADRKLAWRAARMLYPHGAGWRASRSPQEARLQSGC